MAGLHIYTKNEIENLAPYTFNEELIRKKQLQYDYWILYSKYRYLIEQYFLKKLNLDTYDNRIKNSKLTFKPMNDNEKNAYQRYSSMNLSFITLLNNKYIERLSIEDLQKLREATEIELQFIERTYKELIIPEVLDNCTSINYLSATSSGNFVNPEAIVFYINYERNGVGNTDIERTINLIKKDEYISSIKEEIKQNNKDYTIKVI